VIWFLIYRWTRVVCCCWTTGAFTSCSRWRPLPSQDVLLRRRLPNSPLLTWVAFPPHPGPLTLRHGLLLQGGWRSSTAAAAEAAGQPGMLVGVVQQFIIALLWVQYRSPRYCDLSFAFMPLNCLRKCDHNTNHILDSILPIIMLCAS